MIHSEDSRSQFDLLEHFLSYFSLEGDEFEKACQGFAVKESIGLESRKKTDKFSIFEVRRSCHDRFPFNHENKWSYCEIIYMFVERHRLKIDRTKCEDIVFMILGR
jgi:hypothetical protein